MQKNKGCKFSITFDEYMTLRHRRYIGVNIYDSFDRKAYKTGLVGIFGSCPSETLKELIKNHLATFGLCLEKDIVSSTQDGCAVNKKMLKETDILQQFCLNHAIHLGV